MGFSSSFRRRVIKHKNTHTSNDDIGQNNQFGAPLLKLPPPLPITTTLAAKRMSEESSCSSSQISPSSPVSEHASPSTTIASPQELSIKVFKQDLDVSDIVIGRGSFTTVRQSTFNNEVYAFKQPTQPYQASRVIREARLLSEIFNSTDVPEHGIAEFCGAILQTPGLVLRFYPRTVKNHIMAGPTTFHGVYVGRSRWLEWAKQLTHGLLYLQQKGIIHCDLKSDNVFLDSELNAYIGDFSAARSIHHPEQGNEEVTFDVDAAEAFSVQFAAPELLSNSDPKPAFSSDVYSLGLVLLHAATGSEPYQQASKGIAQKLMWARRGHPLLYLSDEDMIRQSSVQHLIELYIKHRQDTTAILAQL